VQQQKKYVKRLNWGGGGGGWACAKERKRDRTLSCQEEPQLASSVDGRQCKWIEKMTGHKDAVKSREGKTRALELVTRERKKGTKKTNRRGGKAID